MLNKHSKRSYIYLVAILLFATIITTISSFLTYKNSIKASESSLQLQAIGIAASIESFINSSGELKRQKNIFKEIITQGRWEGIAFIALYDKNSTIVLHSNENLIGRQSTDKNLKTAIETHTPSHTYITLGTGEKVFVLDFPVHVQNAEKILRIALHTYYAEGIIREARLHGFGMLFITAVLWGIGLFFIRASRRSDELKIKMAEREGLAAIGEMASILAHEIRNPLGSIKGFAQYLKEQIAYNRIQDTDALDIIISESKRLEELTENLLMYSKPIEVKLEDFDLLNSVNEAVKAIQNRNNVDIKVYVPSGIKIRSDKAKLKQALINIIQNAADAESKAIDIKVEYINDLAAVSIGDDGCGMSWEIKENAFKPFFTTKAKGTGLGLAIVDKLIKAIGGKIELQSEPQKGTVFKIFIPRAI